MWQTQCHRPWPWFGDGLLMCDMTKFWQIFGDANLNRKYFRCRLNTHQIHRPGASGGNYPWQDRSIIEWVISIVAIHSRRNRHGADAYRRRVKKPWGWPPLPPLIPSKCYSIPWDLFINIYEPWIVSTYPCLHIPHIFVSSQASIS